MDIVLFLYGEGCLVGERVVSVFEFFFLFLILVKVIFELIIGILVVFGSVFGDLKLEVF